MSLILAISCTDRIVIAADGRAVDYEDGKPSEIIKIFKLTNNSAILVAGGGLIDKLDQYMDDLVHAVRAKGNANIVDIAGDVKEIIYRRNWAQWKDDKERSHMEAIIVGYDGAQPRIYNLKDHRQFNDSLVAHAHGNWENKMNYLIDNLSTDNRENMTKQANKVAIEMLIKATVALPEEVGKPYSVWHILPTGIRKLNASDVASLSNRYS